MRVEEVSHRAALLARRAGVRRLVLTRFSQRYGDNVQPFVDEASRVFADVVAAMELQRVALPPRR